MPLACSVPRSCSRCGSTGNEFPRHRKVKGDGLSSWCKPCWRSYRQQLWTSRPETKQANYERLHRWNKDHPAANRVRQKRHFDRDPERVRRLSAASKRRNLPRVLARNGKRRAAKIGATPLWANVPAINEIYELAALRTRLSGVKHVVDHDVPLIHEKVCGLHCEFNLRVITDAENSRKGNRFTVQ